MRKKNSFGDILETIGNGLLEIGKGLIRLLLKILVTFGLWLPGLYAVLGVILYFGMDFDPFDFSLYSIIYLSGGFACIICAVIISVRNLVINPVKNVVTKSRRKFRAIEDEDADLAVAAAEEARRKEEEAYYPPKADEGYPPARPQENAPSYLLPEETEEEEIDAGALLFDWVPEQEVPTEKPKMKSVPKKEIPEVYFSKLNPSVLVHEYGDRFELYQVIGDHTDFIGVEYK